MTKSPLRNGTDAFELAIQEGAGEKLLLRLYVTGHTPKSKRAIENLRRLCEENFTGRYELEVIDIYQQPSLAMGDQIIAAPTLVKKLPLPRRTLIGDLSDWQRVLRSLDFQAVA